MEVVKSTIYRTTSIKPWTLLALNLVAGNKIKLVTSATPNEADNTETIFEFVELSKVTGFPPCLARAIGRRKNKLSLMHKLVTRWCTVSIIFKRFP